MNRTYAVIIDTEYYQGDCQHPDGWGIRIATYGDDAGEFPCIGTLEECQEWIDELYSGNIYLDHGEAAKIYYIVEIIEKNANYQTWLDSLNWDGCPYPEPKDDEERQANCEWAETEQYEIDGLLYINHPESYEGVIIDLSTKK